MYIKEFVRCLPIKRRNTPDAAYNTIQSINQYLSLYIHVILLYLAIFSVLDTVLIVYILAILCLSYM